MRVSNEFSISTHIGAHNSESVPQPFGALIVAFDNPVMGIYSPQSLCPQRLPVPCRSNGQGGELVACSFVIVLRCRLSGKLIFGIIELLARLAAAVILFAARRDGVGSPSGACVASWCLPGLRLRLAVCALSSWRAVAVVIACLSIVVTPFAI